VEVERETAAGNESEDEGGGQECGGLHAITYKYRIAILYRDARDGEAAAFTDEEDAVVAYGGVGGGEGEGGGVTFVSRCTTAVAVVRHQQCR
jgi:hypothetical protein